VPFFLVSLISYDHGLFGLPIEQFHPHHQFNNPILGISTLFQHSIARHLHLLDNIINKCVSTVIQKFNKILYNIIYKLMFHSKLYN